MDQLTTVIPVYNGEHFLLETLKAVARQTRRADRVVVLDNASTDKTPDIIRNFDLPIEYIRNERNIGIVGNLNKALGYAKETDYLHLLMADDLVAPAFYEKILQAGKLHSAPALIYSYNEDINAEGEVIGPLKKKREGAARVIAMNEFLSRQAELATALLPAVVFRTNRTPALALFDELPQVADSLFIAEWGKKAGLVIEAPQYLCQYRLSPFNETSQNIRNLKSWVLDEWFVMQRVAEWIDEPPAARQRRLHKLKVLFCARSYTKTLMMRAAKSPEYAEEIARAAIGRTSMLHWQLGKAAVVVRNTARRIRGERWRVAESINTSGK